MSEFALKILLPDALHLICIYGSYILYPVIYLFVTVWCLVKLFLLVIVLLMYLLTVCLQILLVALSNLVNLILLLISILLILAIVLVILAFCILALICVAGVGEYVVNHLMLRPKSRILSSLNSLATRR